MRGCNNLDFVEIDDKVFLVGALLSLLKMHFNEELSFTVFPDIRFQKKKIYAKNHSKRIAERRFYEQWLHNFAFGGVLQRESFTIAEFLTVQKRTVFRLVR